MKYIQKQKFKYFRLFYKFPHPEHEISLMIENMNDLNKQLMPFKILLQNIFKDANGFP